MPVTSLILILAVAAPASAAAAEFGVRTDRPTTTNTHMDRHHQQQRQRTETTEAVKRLILTGLGLSEAPSVANYIYTTPDSVRGMTDDGRRSRGGYDSIKLDLHNISFDAGTRQLRLIFDHPLRDVIATSSNLTSRAGRRKSVDYGRISARIFVDTRNIHRGLSANDDDVTGKRWSREVTREVIRAMSEEGDDGTMTSVLIQNVVDDAAALTEILERRDVNASLAIDFLPAGRPEELLRTVSSRRRRSPLPESDCSPLDERTGRRCCRRSMWISFADIGWDDWIVSPPGFDAYSCTESCSAETRVPSTLRQQLVADVAARRNRSNSVDLPDYAPPPLVCAPTSLSPLRIFYRSGASRSLMTSVFDLVVDGCHCV